MRDAARPWVLGIGSSHNGAVCLLRGDEIVVAVQEERLVRSKRATHPAGESSLAVRYCFDYAGIKSTDLSCIGVCNLTGADAADDVYLNGQLRPSANGTPVVTLSHHFGHAVGAFATSGFESAAVLVVDGAGSPWTHLGPGELETVIADQARRFDPGDSSVWETISMYSARGPVVESIEKHVARRRPWSGDRTGMWPFFSLGSLFLCVGRQVFGQSLDSPGKVMGLAPYGRPTIPCSAFLTIGDDEIVYLDDVLRRFAHDERWPQRREEYADLAASAQAALEEALLWLVTRLRRKSTSSRLCYAGGVALNSVANERIVRDGGFDDVFIMPAAEDSGTAVGAAYYALWQLTSRNSRRRLVHDCVGRPYTNDDISASITRHHALHAERSDRVIEHAAALLAAGKIVGWFQGGSELGPRALGQRSILADPRQAGMKDVLNARVKFREAFRPFAPIVLREHAAEWFDVDDEQAESPYMLRVMKFRADKSMQVPAVVHVDRTGRVQTVNADDATARLHALLTAFHERTGVPVLLNTSFNGAGEPIVETPDDALWCFEFSEMDACILEDYIVTKAAGQGSPLDWCPQLTAGWVSEEHALGEDRAAEAHRAPREFFVSVYEGRHAYISAMSKRYRDHLRIRVPSRWGTIVHFASLDLLPVIRLIDGRRTGREILDRLNGDGAQHSPMSLQRLLGRLAKAGVIGFRQSAAGADTAVHRSTTTTSTSMPAAVES